MKERLVFPEGFLWGASTSSHQVEGYNTNDWSEWERANAIRLASGAEKAFKNSSPVWDEIKYEATDPNNYISGAAADHFNRWREDLDLAKKIGLNAYRLSIEWSRVEPREGELNLEAIEHYRQVIKGLKRRGIEPFVTIWHWPLPLWLSKRGGWEYEEISHYYVSFAVNMMEAFGQDVRYWITLNEPNVYTENSYFVGMWPPQRRSPGAYYRALDNLIKAHREVYHILKSKNPGAMVGISNNFIPYVAYRNLWINRILKRMADLRWNFTFLQQIKGHLDFIGVNHYFGYRIHYGLNKRHEIERRSDLGWELYPPSMYHALHDLKEYNLPLFVTENGLADRNDRLRGWFLTETLKQVHKAIHDGVDVRGYFHWSLLDNFEWDKGFWPRFGLIGVDYKTQKRTIRPSAKLYSEIIARNAVDKHQD